MEKDQIYKGKIKHGGIFHFKDYYSFAYDWIISEGYDLTEKKYSEKVAGDAKEIEIEWEAFRKISDYFQFRIKIRWMILGMKDVEVQREGKKVKMNSGTLEVSFTAVIEKDYENRWENKPFFRFLRGVYDRYLIRNRVDDYEQRLVEELLELIDQSKAFLALEAKS
mgnify:CR=1 FL=1